MSKERKKSHKKSKRRDDDYREEHTEMVHNSRSELAASQECEHHGASKDTSSVQSQNTDSSKSKQSSVYGGGQRFKFKPKNTVQPADSKYVTALEAEQDIFNYGAQDQVFNKTRSSMANKPKKSTIEYGDQGSDHIKKEKAKNRLDKTQFDTTEEYIHKLRFSIPLDKLYKVYDSCMNNTMSDFCPILVEIGEKLLKSQRTTEHPYLLQVWTNEGILIFERALAAPLHAWNMHGKLFVFQEEVQENYVDDFFLLEMEKEQECKLYNFKLPPNVSVKETLIEKLAEGVKDQEALRSYINKHETNRILQTIGIAKEHLIVNRGSLLHYISLDEIKEKAKDKGTFSEMELKKHFFRLQDGFQLKQILDIGKNETALMLMCETNRLSFYQIKEFGKQDKYGKWVDVQLTRLGFRQSKSSIDLNEKEDHDDRIVGTAKITSFRYIVRKDKHKTTQPSFTAVCLRDNGSFEFYYDFNLVSVENPQITSKVETFCSEIETDSDNYYITLKYFAPGGQRQQVRTQVYKVALEWGNLISMSVAEEWFAVDMTNPKEQRKFESAAIKGKLNKVERVMLESRHRLISRYFKIFAQFVNFTTFMLVAHREFVSIFDLKNLEAMSLHLKFEDQVKSLSINQLQDGEDSAQVLLTNQMVSQIRNNNGIPERCTHGSFGIDDKIVRVCQDQLNKNTTYFLTQSHGSQDPFTQYQTFVTYDKFEKTKFRQPEPVYTSDVYSLKAVRRQQIQEILLPEDDGSGELLPQNMTMKTFVQNKEGRMMLSYPTQSRILKITIDDNAEETFVVEKTELRYDHYVPLDEKLCSKDKDMICKLEEMDAVDVIEAEQDGNVDKMYLPKGELLGVVTLDDEDNHKRSGYLARLTTRGIEVYNQEGRLQEYFTDPMMRFLIYVDNNYVYCLCENNKEVLKKFDFRRKIFTNARGASITRQDHGLYVYDICRLLLEGQIENYRMAPACVGLSYYIDNSEYSQRLSYFTSFEKISMLPFPHRNTINFIGMGIKEEYLIWREKNGFFTGLHKSGELRIWSLASGKFIGSKKKTDIPEEGCPNKVNVSSIFDQYEIYQASENDTCYKRGFQNFEGYTLQLMIKKEAETILPSHKANRQKQMVAFKSMPGNTVKTSSQDNKTYELIVLKLTTGEDFNEKLGEQEDLRVSILFRFQFKLGLVRPTLHLSKDCNKLMEVIEKKVAVIYTKTEGTRDENHVYSKWVKKTRIHQYPTILQGTTTLPFLFDPKFERYIDVDLYEKQLLIKTVDDSQPPIKIPNTLLGLTMTLDEEHMQGSQEQKTRKILNEKSVEFVAKRMHFVSKNLIRFINKEGIDLLFDIQRMKVVSFSKLDNLTTQKSDATEHKHLILEQNETDLSDILTRLVRRCQSYKSDIEFAKYKLACKEFWPYQKQKRYRKPDLLSFVYKVSHQASGPNGFMAEMSFTLLDWIICEKIQTDGLFDFNDIDRYQQIELCFNIFPNNMTMLHKLALAADKDAESENTRSIDQVVQTLFSVCKKGLNQSHQYYRIGCPFEIPLIEDINGQTALDIAFSTDDQIDKIGLHRRIKEFTNLFFKIKQDNIFKKDKKQTDFLETFQRRTKKYAQKNLAQFQKKQRMLNTQLAVIIFANIQSYGYLHSSALLTRSLIKAIKIGLPGIGEYLDSRMIASQHMPPATQHDLKNKPLIYMHTSDTYEGYEENSGDSKWLENYYNAIDMQLWDDKKVMQTKLFKEQGVQKNMFIKYLDAPLLHLSSKDGFQFINALSDLRSQHLDIYSKRSIQILINHHWEKQKFKLNVMLFTPFIVMLLTFVLWSNFTLHIRDDPEGWSSLAGGYFQTILIVLASFFLFIEVIKLVTHPIEYLKSVWNWVGLPPLVLVLYNATIADTETYGTSQFWYVQAFAGLFMWFRSLYYLRGFEKFSYFIRMLIAVVTKIRIFLAILAIVVCGFADTFYSLAQTEDPVYVSSYVHSLKYSYEIVIGQFDDNLNDQNSLSWVFFTLSSVISMLILANLLIEIVSETYGEVTEKKYLYVFKERCDLICDVQTISSLVHTVNQAGRFTYAMILKLIYYCSWKQYRPRNQIKVDQARRHITESCSLLVVAWEDPSNKDPTPDCNEDEMDDTPAEKLDTVVSRIGEMNKKLGLDSDNDSEEENAMSMASLNEKLDRILGIMQPRQAAVSKWQEHECAADDGYRGDRASLAPHKQGSTSHRQGSVSGYQNSNAGRTRYQEQDIVVHQDFLETTMQRKQRRQEREKYRREGNQSGYR